MKKLKSFFIKSKRVWAALKKPTMQEFKMTAKIAALGIAAVGIIGFLISLIMNIFQ